MNLSSLDLRCPHPCGEKLVEREQRVYCTKKSCVHSQSDTSFRILEGTPVLISEHNCDTVCDPNKIRSYVPRSQTRAKKIKNFFSSESKVTIENCSRFITHLKAFQPSPRILVIGAGEQGSGTEKLWSSNDLNLVGVDIYATPNVNVVCDAHYLPFPDQSFDGVWIQAVLEHVVEPDKVVQEIHRVLKLDGIVYAETPFMQQVHEGAYDFTRFTVLGHRYLFKKFKLIAIGGNQGTEVSLAWSIRYFVWGLTRSHQIARITGSLSGLFLKLFSRFMSKESLYDGASGVFFLGKKAKDIQVSHKELIALYEGNIR